eukprot:13981567-Heterocapsa_arctica.AAC.1
MPSSPRRSSSDRQSLSDTSRSTTKTSSSATPSSSARSSPLRAPTCSPDVDETLIATSRLPRTPRLPCAFTG